MPDYVYAAIDDLKPHRRKSYIPAAQPRRTVSGGVSLQRFAPVSEAEARNLPQDAPQKQWSYFLPYMQDRPEQFAAARSMSEWGSPTAKPLSRSDLVTYTLPSGGTATVKRGSRVPSYITPQSPGPIYSPDFSRTIGETGAPPGVPMSSMLPLERSYTMGYTGGREGVGVTMPDTGVNPALNAAGAFASRQLGSFGNYLANLFRKQPHQQPPDYFATRPAMF